MSSITFEEMQQIQVELREKYGKWWGELNPREGARTLLWMIGEATEVGDIIKKQGEDAVMDDPDVRRHFIEEMCDVLMYFNDLMICFGITPEEVTEEYWKKHRYNMDRWD
ncbi:MAG: nucleotide pyrophosphohydrolase [Firmicutes bacterium]|nr:nucleotide pyrophosphohydrolase [Bacillota bacterium]